MIVSFDNLHAHVVNATPDEDAWLVDYLSFNDRSAYFRRGRRPGSNRVRLYSSITQTFPTGLLPLVRKAAAKDGHKVETLDKRVRPVEFDPEFDASWLYDYQRESFDASVKHGRGIVWIPTAGGKGEILAALAGALYCRWLVVLPSRSLLAEIADRIEARLGERVGRIGDKFDYVERVTVATFQSLASTLRKRKGKRKREPHAVLVEAEALAVDEVHTLPAASFNRVGMATPNAYYRIGFSGTPLARGDRKSLLAIGTTGPVIYRIKSEVLVDAGRISKPSITMIPVVQTSSRPTWQGVYGECIVRSSLRNRAVVAATKRATKPCFVFVRELKHGRKLRDMIRDAGMRAEFVWGDSSEQTRKNAIRNLEWGDLDVVVCSVIFQHGIDVPELRSVVVASGGKSTIAALQRIGRALRVAKNKTECEVYDFDDRGHRWLERHTRERIKAYASEGHRVVIESEVFGGGLAKPPEVGLRL